MQTFVVTLNNGDAPSSVRFYELDGVDHTSIPDGYDSTTVPLTFIHRHPS